MIIKYNGNFSNSSIVENLERLTNLIFKLLPMREEGKDWIIPLQNIIVEITGMGNLLIDQQTALFSVVSRLEGLLTYTDKDDFLLFRKTIFECLGLLSKVKRCLMD